MNAIYTILVVIAYAMYCMAFGYYVGKHLNKIKARWYVGIPIITILASINGLGIGVWLP